MVVRIFYQRARSAGIVKRDFELRGLRNTGRLSQGRLRRFTEPQYEHLLTLIDAISKETTINRVKMFRPEKISPQALIAYDQGMVMDALRACVEGNTLDLSLFSAKWADQLKIKGFAVSSKPVSLPFKRGEISIDKILNAILKQADIFEQIANNPNSTIEDVFAQIDEGKIKLGFRNVAVYRPKRDEDGNWILTQRTQEWTEDLSKYDPSHGGAPPTGTLKSVLDGEGIIYDLDLCDRNTFDNQGVYFDESSARNDFEYAVGAKLKGGRESRRMLYVKIQSGDASLFSKYGAEGVILFHNQVAKKGMHRNPLPLLSENEARAELVKKHLRQVYIKAIVDAIDAIRRREIAEALRKPPKIKSMVAIEPKPFGYHATDEAKLSRTSRYIPQSVLKQIRLRDRRKVNLEIIKPPQRVSIKDYFAQQKGNFRLLEQDFRIVSALSTGVNKDASVEQYLSQATELIIARDAETNVFMGYVAAQPTLISKIPSIFIWGDYSLPQYHHLGLGTAMGAESVKQAKKMLDIGKQSRIYILFRTWNPAAYKITRRGDFSLFPLPNQDGTGVLREPTPIENRLFTYVAQNLLGTNIDVDTAVLVGMIEPASKINWLGKPNIDTFFREVVRVQEGRALLVTSSAPRFFELLHPLRELYIRYSIILGLFIRSFPIIGRLFKKKKRTVDWDAYFEAYDVLNEFIPYQQVLQRMGDLLEIEAGMACLDLGSGTGNMALELKQRGGKVFAVDNSLRGMALHRSKDSEADIHEVDLNQEEGGFLPFADHSIDRISANHVVNYIKERTVLYQELKRVLRLDGIVVVSVLSKGFNPLKVLLGHMKLEYKELRKTKGRIAALKEVYANFNKRHPRLNIVGEANKAIVESAAGGAYDLLTVEEIRQEWEAAGFEVISIEPHYAGQDYIVKLRPRLV